MEVEEIVRGYDMMMQISFFLFKVIVNMNYIETLNRQTY